MLKRFSQVALIALTLTLSSSLVKCSKQNTDTELQRLEDNNEFRDIIERYFGGNRKTYTENERNVAIINNVEPSNEEHYHKRLDRLQNLFGTDHKAARPEFTRETTGRGGDISQRINGYSIIGNILYKKPKYLQFVSKIKRSQVQEDDTEMDDSENADILYNNINNFNNHERLPLIDDMMRWDDTLRNNIVKKRYFSLWNRMRGLSPDNHEIHHRKHLHAFYNQPEKNFENMPLTAETRALFMRPPGSPLRWG